LEGVTANQPNRQNEQTPPHGRQRKYWKLQKSGNYKSLEITTKELEITTNYWILQQNYWILQQNY
jgi:hypothetical protein